MPRTATAQKKNATTQPIVRVANSVRRKHTNLISLGEQREVQRLRNYHLADDDLQFRIQSLQNNQGHFDGTNEDDIDDISREFLNRTTVNTLTHKFIHQSGEKIDLRELPAISSKLSSKQALLLLDRFEKRFAGEVSSGRATTCFETHVNYVIGSSRRLNLIQKSTILGMCRIIKSRPVPALFIAHHILRNINHPASLRTILTASIGDKSKSIHRILNSAPDVFDRILNIKSPTGIKILLLGFAESLINFVEKLRNLAATHGRRFTVLVPKLGSEKLSHEAICEILKNRGISSIAVSEREVLDHSISVTLAATRLVTWSRTGKLRVLSSHDAASFYKTARDIAKSQKKPSPPKIITISGVFKIWPCSFHQSYRSAFVKQGLSETMRRDAFFSHSSLDSIITEHGLTPVRNMEDSRFLKFINNEVVAEEVFFFKSAFENLDLHWASEEFKKYFSRFLKKDVLNKDDFCGNARFTVDVLFGHYDGRGKLIEMIAKSVSTSNRAVSVNDLKSIRSDFPSDSAFFPAYLLSYSKENLVGFLDEVEKFYNKLLSGKDFSDDASEKLKAMVSDSLKIYTKEARSYLNPERPALHGPFVSGILFFGVLKDYIEPYAREGRTFIELTSKADTDVIANYGSTPGFIDLTKS